MKKITTLFTLLVVALTTGFPTLFGQTTTLGNQQNNDFWLKVYDAVGECGYADAMGTIHIDFGKYPVCFTDTMYHYAVVYKPDRGLIAINRDEKELFNVFAVDNGPDYIREGLFRIINDNKIGFANESGEIVIEPQFDYVTAFSDGLAAFCVKCRFEKEGEYKSVSGGLWGFVNAEGKTIYNAKYRQLFNNGSHKPVYEKNRELFTQRNRKLEKLMDDEQITIVNQLTAAHEYGKALEILFVAEKSSPKDYNILISIASIYKQQGDHENAIIYYNKIIKHGNKQEKETAEKLIRGMSIK